MNFKKIFYSFLCTCCFTHVVLPQAAFVFNTNSNTYARISGNAFLTIDNTSPTAIISSSVANIISENENNAIKWHIQNNVGNYVVPFTTNSLVKIPLQLNITTAGVSTSGDVIFSTYETTTDKNDSYPSDVTHLNSNCRDSTGLFNTDRFWRIEADNYTTKPTPIITFGYDNSPNEMGGFNTITEGKLKAQRFNNSNNSWETPQKLYGLANTSSQVVSNVNVTPIDFYKSWTLVDSVIMSIPISITSASSTAICSGSFAVITATGATSYTLFPNGISSTSNFSVFPTSTSTYSVLGAIGTGSALCFSTLNSASVVTVNVNALPNITTTVTDVTCFGESSGSISSNVVASSAFTYTWSNGSNVGSVTNLSAGIYALFVQDANMCSSSQTVLVNQPNPLLINEISSQPSCDNAPTGKLEIIISGGVPNYALQWSNGSTSSVLSQLAVGMLTATVTDANGCQQTYSSQISEEKCLTTLIPQLFSPNADEKNDVFFINTASYYPNNKLEIYNRWGNLVYSKEKYDNTFNGKASVNNSIGNGLLPAGTYFIVFDFGDGSTKPYNGYLELRY